jgi:D-threo-aldose 1-dehydrogenase
MPTKPFRISVDEYRQLGNTGLRVPPIVFGSTALGNRFQALPEQTKIRLCCEWFRHVAPPVFIDTAGKYGAGMALEVIGRALNRLDIPQNDVVINNRLAWKRMPLRTSEPGFEPGVWVNVEHDAQRCISYDGILACWEEGCRLLGGHHRPQLVSVHDPDDYLSAATSAADRDRRFQNILDAYRALNELKEAGLVLGIGVDAKDWKPIRELERHVKLDWVMMAGSFTVMNHPPELLEFIASLKDRGLGVINSAVFHGGFLVGGRYFDCRVVSPDNPVDRPIYAWRKAFVALCHAHGVAPAEACVEFGRSAPGISAIALNTSHPDRIADNVEMVLKQSPSGFWASMKEERLIAEDYPYLG